MTATALPLAEAEARRGLGLLALSVVLFGTAWPVMKVGLQGATPIWYAAARAGLGALVAFALLLALGRLRRPTRADLPIILSIGAFQLTAFFAFSNLGLRLIPAGRSVVLAYTTALWLVPLAMLTGERIGAGRLAGVLLGLAGIAVLLNPLSIDWSNAAVVTGHAFLLLAALSWALAIFHARRHVWRLSPLQLLPWQMLLAAVLLTALALAFEPDGHIDATPGVLLALVYLGVLAGPLASWAATSVARALPTLVTSIGLLGVPVIGVAISTLWLGEPVTLSLALGAGLVLLGVGTVAVNGAR